MKKNEKTPKTKTTNSERETRVLLEDIRKEVKTIAEGHGTIIRKLDEHDKRFVKIESELDTVKMAVMQISGDIKDLKEEVAKDLSDHKTRIVKLEEKVFI